MGAGSHVVSRLTRLSRHFVQDPSPIRRHFRHTLSGPLLPLHFIVQLDHEALLHR